MPYRFRKITEKCPHCGKREIDGDEFEVDYNPQTDHYYTAWKYWCNNCGKDIDEEYLIPEEEEE